MNEIQLQSGIVRKFSELYPEKRGQLFHVSNERNNPIQAMNAKGIGIFNGVADLLYFEFLGDDCLGGHIMLTGLEVKAPGYSHKREHIETQLEWGKILVSNGGIWRIVRSVEEAINCIECPFGNGLNIEQVEQILREQKGKTIKF